MKKFSTSQNLIYQYLGDWAPLDKIVYFFPISKETLYKKLQSNTIRAIKDHGFWVIDVQDFFYYFFQDSEEDYEEC